MARHEAPDGAAAHPLVEAALRRRAHASHGAHRAQLPGTEGPIGWPGPEREEGGGIGWPGDLPGGADSEHAESEDQSDDEPPALRIALPQPRGLRGLLGRTSAA